jgi:hypothetical protein
MEALAVAVAAVVQVTVADMSAGATAEAGMQYPAVTHSMADTSRVAMAAEAVVRYTVGTSAVAIAEVAVEQLMADTLVVVVARDMGTGATTTEEQCQEAQSLAVSSVA